MILCDIKMEKNSRILENEKAPTLVNSIVGANQL